MENSASVGTYDQDLLSPTQLPSTKLTNYPRHAFQVDPITLIKHKKLSNLLQTASFTKNQYQRQYEQERIEKFKIQEAQRRNISKKQPQEKSDNGSFVVCIDGIQGVKMKGHKSNPRNRHSLLSVGEYFSGQTSSDRGNEIESFRFGKNTVNVLESSRSNLTKQNLPDSAGCSPKLQSVHQNSIQKEVNTSIFNMPILTSPTLNSLGKEKTIQDVLLRSEGPIMKTKEFGQSKVIKQASFNQQKSKLVFEPKKPQHIVSRHSSMGTSLSINDGSPGIGTVHRKSPSLSVMSGNIKKKSELSQKAQLKAFNLLKGKRKKKQIVFLTNEDIKVKQQKKVNVESYELITCASNEVQQFNNLLAIGHQVQRSTELKNPTEVTQEGSDSNLASFRQQNQDITQNNIAKVQQIAESLYNPKKELKTAQFFFPGKTKFEVNGGTQMLTSKRPIKSREQNRDDKRSKSMAGLEMKSMLVQNQQTRQELNSRQASNYNIMMPSSTKNTTTAITRFMPVRRSALHTSQLMRTNLLQHRKSPALMDDSKLSTQKADTKRNSLAQDNMSMFHNSVADKNEKVELKHVCERRESQRSSIGRNSQMSNCTYESITQKEMKINSDLQGSFDILNETEDGISLIHQCHKFSPQGSVQFDKQRSQVAAIPCYYNGLAQNKISPRRSTNTSTQFYPIKGQKKSREEKPSPIFGHKRAKKHYSKYSSVDQHTEKLSSRKLNLTILNIGTEEGTIMSSKHSDKSDGSPEPDNRRVMPLVSYLAAGSPRQENMLIHITKNQASQPTEEDLKSIQSHILNPVEMSTQTSPLNKQGNTHAQQVELQRYQQRAKNTRNIVETKFKTQIVAKVNTQEELSVQQPWTNEEIQLQMSQRESQCESPSPLVIRSAYTADPQNKKTKRVPVKTSSQNLQQSRKEVVVMTQQSADSPSSQECIEKEMKDIQEALGQMDNNERDENLASTQDMDRLSTEKAKQTKQEEGRAPSPFAMDSPTHHKSQLQTLYDGKDTVQQSDRSKGSPLISSSRSREKSPKKDLQAEAQKVDFVRSLNLKHQKVIYQKIPVPESQKQYEINKELQLAVTKPGHQLLNKLETDYQPRKQFGSTVRNSRKTRFDGILKSQTPFGADEVRPCSQPQGVKRLLTRDNLEVQGVKEKMGHRYASPVKKIGSNDQIVNLKEHNKLIDLQLLKQKALNDDLESLNNRNGSFEVQTEISNTCISHVKKFTMDEQEALETKKMFCFINQLGTDDLNSIYKEDEKGTKDECNSPLASPLMRQHFKGLSSRNADSKGLENGTADTLSRTTNQNFNRTHTTVKNSVILHKSFKPDERKPKIFQVLAGKKRYSANFFD